MKKTYADPTLKVKVFTEIMMITESGVNGADAATAALNTKNVDTMSLKDNLTISL